VAGRDFPTRISGPNVYPPNYVGSGVSAFTAPESLELSSPVFIGMQNLPRALLISSPARDRLRLLATGMIMNGSGRELQISNWQLRVPRRGASARTIDLDRNFIR
jgi:hypothetical protein